MAKSKDFGRLAEAQLRDMGLGSNLSDVNCWQRNGGDPTRPDDWDCAAIDGRGDALTWGVRVSGSHTDLSPVQGSPSP